MMRIAIFFLALALLGAFVHYATRCPRTVIVDGRPLCFDDGRYNVDIDEQ